jgi:hypothetical protein
MMSDQEIREVAARIDDIILNLCADCHGAPLILSGILLARLTYLNDILETGKDFRELVKFIARQPVMSLEDETIKNFDDANALLAKFRKK